MSQVPTSTNPPISEPIQSVCDAYQPVNTGGGLGPGGTGFATAPADGQVVPAAGTDGNLYVGGEVVHSFDHLVYIQKQPFGPDMAPYLISMIEGANADGVALSVTSGHRTYDKQWDLKNGGTRTGDYSSRSQKYKDMTATPGYSPHQCGLAVDFSIKGADKNPAYEWLVKNAYKYGFIRRVRHERWHWEYLGTWPHIGGPPEYAKKWEAYSKRRGTIKESFRWGCPMFFFVYRDGSNARSLSSKFGDSSHPDYTNSKPNTWVNWFGELLPDKFDREDPGWDQRTAQPPPPGTSEQPTDELGTSV